MPSRLSDSTLPSLHQGGIIPAGVKETLGGRGVLQENIQLQLICVKSSSPASIVKVFVILPVGRRLGGGAPPYAPALSLVFVPSARLLSICDLKYTLMIQLSGLFILEVS